MSKFLEIYNKLLQEAETIEAPPTTKPKTTPKRHPFAPKPGQSPKPRPKASLEQEDESNENVSVKLFKRLRNKK
jgi:hypothetical protein